MVGCTSSGDQSADCAVVDADADLVADAPTDLTKQVDPENWFCCYIADDDGPRVSRSAWKAFTDHLSK